MITNQNDIYEQLTDNKRQLANVRETLTHISEMEVWEVKEYQAVEAGYIARIAELEAAIVSYEATPVSGYTVEVVNGANVAYKLHGTRGAEYRLVRNIYHPELMFAINSNGNVCGIKGNYTFIDTNGPLRPYYGVE